MLASPTMDSPESVNKKMAQTFLDVTAGLKSESDRGCVVLAVAWIDDELTRMITSLCLPSQEKTDELFGSGRALNDFATKINLAYRLGLIRKQTLGTLHLFRRMRNDFAHLSSELSFETPAVHDRVLAIFDREKIVLDAIWSEIKEDENLSSVLGSASPENGYQTLLGLLGTRKLFEITVATMASGLVLACSQILPVKALEET